MNHVAMAHVLVPFSEESGREVDRHYVSPGIIDISGEHDETSLQGLAKSGTKEAVDHDIILPEIWRGEIAFHLCEVDSVHSDKLLAFLVAVMAELAEDIEKEHLYLSVALLEKDTGNGKCVAAIVALSCHDHDSLAWKEPGYNLTTDCPRSPLHKVDGIKVLGFAGSVVYFSYNV